MLASRARWVLRYQRLETTDDEIMSVGEGVFVAIAFLDSYCCRESMNVPMSLYAVGLRQVMVGRGISKDESRLLT